MYRILGFLFAIILATSAAQAQQNSWVQIEAQPSLARAEQSIRQYATNLQDVNGFSIGAGWYAIALGPYTPERAQQILAAYRAERLIPRDSYIAVSSDYQQQFWPVGTNLLTAPALSIGVEETATNETENEPSESVVETVIAEPEPADETPREARASERDLSREERADLQVALKWAGFYEGAIDAAFGRGTRNSMSAWQTANGFEATGILTTLQRAELLRQYNAVLDGMGLKLVQDSNAGIEMKLPLGVVAFEKLSPPFVHYSATGDIDAKVLLISQEGDSNTLGGLYDIMQTLEIVPDSGPRTLKSDAFTLIGEGAFSISHTQAWLKNGEIKGFTLVWPAGDEERRTRILGEMQESFQRLDGVLDPAAGAETEQSIDLVAGLEIRKPRMSRSGFFVDRSGVVVTTAEAVQGCRKITIEDVYDAELAASDPALGIAVLRPSERLAPMAVATFQSAPPRLQSDVAVAGYSYGGVLGAPTLTFGRLADVKGLNGETEMKRLALSTLEGDAGGPVVDAGGAVLGMLLPNTQNGRQLPEGVSFAADADAVRAVLEQAGVTTADATDSAQMAAEALTREVVKMTVLVSCWD
ncbi:peptidoglycan-binding protein [Roseovarius faecimaris]|uniref:Peptidoglycan-binding protein n=1 Tax=Roseovarius faecimaris TaxID=2494550 RepID=A0A6I6IW51_9RHOB|nr:serine protease [Roseovarius faecimaris]QGY00305.1 peptidoglycan-binding protein [Roseovarius faecimaris]